MNLSKIDENFAIGSFQDDGNTRYYSIPCEPFDLYGVFYEKKTACFVRMPSEIADTVNEGVVAMNTYTAGGRIRFSTDSKSISLVVRYSDLLEMAHMPLSGNAGFILLEETERGFKHVKSFFPPHSAYDKSVKKGYSVNCDLCGKMANYILYFPLYNDVKSLAIGLDKNAVVAHGKKYKDIKPILYYGSSITQGGVASRPDNSYQSIISKTNNIDYVNLGFSGSGKAEYTMCEYLSGIDCSVFVCDYDHNAPNAEYLKNTHYRLYKTFREKQKNTPVVFISKPDIEHNSEWKKRRNIIKSTYLMAKKSGDDNVYFIDGSKFFGKERDACTVDGCHPNDYGFYKMAKKIGAVLEKILKK